MKSLLFRLAPVQRREIGDFEEVISIKLKKYVKGRILFMKTAAAASKGENNIEYINIVKAIGIIMMVVGHIGANIPINRFIYLFHMPLFFFISGYLFKEEYFDKPGIFIFKRAKRLYIPFVIYNIIFLMCRNLFFCLHFFDPEITPSVQMVTGKDDFLMHLFYILRFSTSEMLLPAFWFPVALFTTNLLFIIAGQFKKKYGDLILILLSIAGIVWSLNRAAMGFTVFLNCNHAYMALHIFTLGYLYRKHEKTIDSRFGKIKGGAAAAVAFVVLAVMAKADIKVEMSKNLYGNIYLFLLGECLGIFFVIYISKLLHAVLKGKHRVLNYISKNSFTIMALHILAFKPVSYLAIKADKADIKYFAQYVYNSRGTMLWIPYLLAGIFLPLAAAFIMEKIPVVMKKFESAKKNERRQIVYINGLKGIACITVMLGHYFSLYSMAESFIPVPQFFKILMLYGLSIFTDAGFGLGVFCFLSGYLVSMTRIENSNDFLRKGTKRFLRFYLPVLGANLFVYAIYKTIGFHNAQTAELFTNTWFERYYKFDFDLKFVLDSAYSTVLFQTNMLNGPFWTIQLMFYSSLIIYIANYLEGKYYKLRYFIYVLLIVIECGFFSSNGFAIALGYIACKLSDSRFMKKKVNTAVLLMAAVIMFIMIDGGHTYLINKVGLPVLNYAIWWKIAYFAIFFITIERIDIIKTLLERKPILMLNKISFGIYALHWPIICSVISVLFLRSSFNFTSYIAYAFILVTITFAAAILYHFTVENISNKIIDASKL